MLFQANQSDGEFIERTRRLVQFWDRWRHFVTIGGLAVIGWSVWYMYATWQSMADIDANDPLMLAKLNKTWMLISLFVGLGLGINFAGLISYMVKSIFGGYRAERMLLKLHSELHPSREDIITG